MKKSKLFIVAIVMVVVGLIIGRFTAPSHDSRGDASSLTGDGTGPSEYTCSMHPQIRQPNPGKCPICAMDLIPAGQADKEDTGPREISLSRHAQALARIQTAPVERRIPEAEIRLFGQVEMDETRTRSITARFPARIERLYVNYTGMQVKSGDHLARIYSPELLTAQAELISALRFGDPRAIRASREKLLLWGLGENAIKAIESKTEPSDTMDINSPLGGFITRKMVSDGDYVETGAALFEIADLSHVWVVLDAYEMDKTWLRFGQSVEFTAEALPGKVFKGRISFIPPVLDTATRTFKIRVNVANEDRLLRPGMFVTAVVKAQVAGEGVVLDSSLEGKWISPMHPEIVKDGPGTCDVCGMDLVPAAGLGYVAADSAGIPLLVPASAVMQTGKRAVVYVEVPDRERPTYEGREIALGPRAGDNYIVVSGLKDGERVVTHGAFKLDSALQILAKPSMMSGPDPDAPRGIEATPEMRDALGKLLHAYFPVWRALAGDDLPSAKEAAGKLESATHQFHGLPGTAGASEFFESTLAALSKSAGETAKADEIEAARRTFEHLSNAMIRAVRTVGLNRDTPAFLAFCPMAFEGRRADWLQNDEELLNPYFGSAMLGCGGLEEIAVPSAVAPARAPVGHRH